MLTQKCQYGLKAVLELAMHTSEGSVKIADIAKAQGIPLRFLEVILNELKQGGFVISRRGNEGGYSLLRDPRRLTVGDVIRFIDGPFGPVNGPVSQEATSSPGYSDQVFQPLWKRASEALSRIYDTTTFSDLLKEHDRMHRRMALNYAI